MQNVVDKARSTGNEAILVCERGFSFGYNNLVSDMRSLSILRATGCPVVFDANPLGAAAGRAGLGFRRPAPSSFRCWHARRLPPGWRGCSSWRRTPTTAAALSDGPNAWPLERMEPLLGTLCELDRAVKKVPFEESLL